MASGGVVSSNDQPLHSNESPSLFHNTSIGQEISGSWMNLSGSLEKHESRFPKRASQIMSVLKLKLAILSGGRDDEGRVIITFPARPRGTQYDHTHLLQTLQYLSTVPSVEASDLGFVLLIDGRVLPWSDIKLILRTSEEALPAQIHVAYIVQPSQFVQKQQISMALSKEKDKIEFTIIKISSVEKITRHINQRQITLDLSGLLNYNHDEWLKLRSTVEDLIDTYEGYVVTSGKLQVSMKTSSALSPERLSDLQAEMSRLESIKVQIDLADQTTKHLANSLKTEIEAKSGSTSLTPEMVNTLATVTKVLQNTEEQQTLLNDLHEQCHRRINQSFSLKQFELGFAKVNQWIKTKGMDKVSRVDIGDSIPNVLSIQDDFKKLESKAEAVATDVTELRRIADIMMAEEHYAKDAVKERLKKINAKHSKFKAAFERRKLIVTNSVAMYKGITGWRQLYEEHTNEWSSSSEHLTDIESVKQLIIDLESQHTHLKDLAQTFLTKGQELVKTLKTCTISQGDPQFRRSLRFISRVTEEVTEKLRKCHELVTVRRSRLEQYDQLLVCERDAKEGMKNLQGILVNLQASHGGVGSSLETTISISTEVEQHEEETKRNHTYARRLLQLAFQQRAQLEEKKSENTLLLELDNLASIVYGIIDELKCRLDLSKNLFSVYEPTQLTMKQLSKMLDNPTDESALKELKTNLMQSFTICKNIISDLQNRLKEPFPSIDLATCRVQSNSAVNESLRLLSNLLSSIERQEEFVHTQLEQNVMLHNQDIRLSAMEQSIEDILIWLKEYGLSQFSEFLALSFTSNEVHDQWTDFCAFRETCDALTKQVEELDESIKKELQDGEAVSRTRRRIGNLNTIWKRFLMRVNNREKVLASLHKFLLQSMELASIISEMLKSTDFQERQTELQSAYDTTNKQGSDLLVLLKNSPGDSKDSNISSKVSDRLEHLTNLYRQLQPLINKPAPTNQSQTVLNNGDRQLPLLLATADIEEPKQQHNVDADSKRNTTDKDVHVDVLVNETVTIADEVVLESLPTVNEMNSFEETESTTTKLIDNFSADVTQFLLSHDVLPSLRDKIEEELVKHETFTDQKRHEHEQLKGLILTLQSYLLRGSVPEERVQYCTNKVKNVLQKHISLLERRITALQTFICLYELKDKCTSLNDEINLFLCELMDDAIRASSTQECLKTCNLLQQKLDAMKQKCKELTEQFRDISSEVEMRGTEARRVMRQIRQEIEDTCENCNYGLQKRKHALEIFTKNDDLETKLKELMGWMTRFGIPGIASVTFGQCLEDTKQVMNDIQNIVVKGESMAVELKVVTDSINSSNYSSLTDLSDEVKTMYLAFQKTLSLNYKALEATESFFTSAKVLSEELESVLHADVTTQQALNPIVIEKLYLVLCTQAKDVCSKLNSIGGSAVESTIFAVNNCISEIEKLINIYTLSQASSDLDDTNNFFILLDNFLLDIEKDVQEALDAAVKKSPETSTKTPLKQEKLKTTEKKHIPSSPRLGTVRNLKKLFESDVPDPNDPPKAKLRSAIPANTTNTPKRKISTTSSVVEPSISQPNALQQTNNDNVFVVMAKEAAPLHTTITVNIRSITKSPDPISATQSNVVSNTATSPPVVPPLPTVNTELPKRPPTPPETDDDTPPPTPPPIRPPPPVSDTSSQDTDLAITDDTEETVNRPLNDLLSVELPRSLNASDDEDSISEHTPVIHSPCEPNELLTGTTDPIHVCVDDLNTEEHLNEDSIDKTTPDMYSSVHNGYFVGSRIMDLREEESIRHRDLSPVLEELEEDELHLSHDDPDFGKRENKMEWTRAHKQSMLSMKAIIRNFYEDETQYTDILTSLLQVYAPILEHTGIFQAVYPISEFQQVFLEELTQSVVSIQELCGCFQRNLENFKLYFPFVLAYDSALQTITNINPDEMSSLLPPESKSSESDLIMAYTAPYHRIEIYCSLFQQLLRAAFKEDLMNLSYLSETLECLLDLLRVLAMELATTKLVGCPFPVFATDILAMNPFLVHLANKVKEVYLYTVFLHPQSLIISERHLDKNKEHTLYTYIMHIPISGMVLVENFRGLSDRFAVCEKGQVAAENFVVFRSCEDSSVKDYWVTQLKNLLLKEAESTTPRETLLPEHIEQIGYMLPTEAPPTPGPSKRLEPLRRKRKQKSDVSYDSTDDDIIETSAMDNVYRVIMDHRTDSSHGNNYLNVCEGDLVEVLDIKGNNYYVAKFDCTEEEDDMGYVPVCCVEPLAQTVEFNQNSNNNTPEKKQPSLIQNISNFETTGDLKRDWLVFCLRTGTFEPFPDCSSEHELLVAKMDTLAKYHNDRSQCLSNIDTTLDSTDGSLTVETSQESARRVLYQAEFLGNGQPDGPSYAQLNGVFSLKHPYVALKKVESIEEEQISLRKGQLVTVLDSKREDWWLVSTFPEGDIDRKEGWVKHNLLQHAEYIREDVVEKSHSTSAFSIQLWLTLARYNATDEGTISINQGELVEVIDNSRNKWSLVRTLGRQPREGWIPTEYITPYNFSENDSITSPVSPGISVHPSIIMDDSVSSTEGTFDFSVPYSPTPSFGELDNEEKRKEALEQRECTLKELYNSENEYVDRLEYCIINYKEAIESGSAMAPRFLRAISPELFTNIVDIHRFHKEEILPQLEGCQTNPSSLVDMFSHANSHLKSLYITYCKGQKRSESVLREFTELFEELRSKLKDRLSLRDYLILPVQRITKYNLLLKNVHEFGIKAGCPIPHFETVLGAAQEISRQANNAVHMSMIDGMHTKKMSELGKLVLQDEFGFLDQTAKGLFKARRVFLFEKCLIIAKSKKESLDRESYVIKENFLLNEISLGEDQDSHVKSIVIYEMITGNKFILKASNQQAHEEWLKKANELASLSRKMSMAIAAVQKIPAGGRSRSMSEPADVPLLSTLSQGLSNSPTPLVRQGSQRLRRSARNMSRPSSAVHKIENYEPGTTFIAMERIIPQGGEEFELEPGEEVELVKVESNGLLTICTMDEHRFSGTVPSGYLRQRELVKENMETAPKVTVALSDMTQFVYDTVSISCAFNGFPDPTVEWRHRTNTIETSDRIKISSCATSSVLEIIDLHYGDEGQYSCVLSNDLGEDITAMDLFIEGPPMPPSRPVASRVTQSSVKLKWHPPMHDGHSIITSYIVEQLREGFGDWQPIVQQSRTTFVVKTLKPKTWYQFRIIACNDNGESRASEPSEIVSTARGRAVPIMSPATKRGLILDTSNDTLSKDETEQPGATHIHMSASHEELSTIGVPSSAEPVVSYHMIRHSSVGSLYDLLPDELGRGRYGILHRCINKTSGVVHCAKYLKQTEQAINEVKMLHDLCRGKACNNLVQWVDAISTESNIVMIMEFVGGGELIDHILKKDCLTEGVIVCYLKQLLNALDYIHEKKITHCDIKPENILLTFDDPPVLKLIDFGSAHLDQSKSSLHIAALAHSLEFCAPEIINVRTVTTFADMWSVGILTYILLCGMSPFFVESTQILMQKIADLSYDFNHPDFLQVSPEAKDFVCMMLKRNPTQRLSAPDALQHSWIKTLGEAFGRCSSWPMPRIDLNKLKIFHARRKLQISVIATRASSVFKSHSSGNFPLSPLPVQTDHIHTSLDIIESPPILDEGTEEVQAPINANVTLEWLYSGYPVPSIVWECKERKVVPSGRVNITSGGGVTQLHITGVVKADEGIYTCCALNSLGSDVQECRLVVLDKPSAPFNVTGLLLDSTSALVSWSMPISSGNSPITHYILEVRQMEYDQWELVNDQVNGMAHVTNDLLPGATYLFRVAAVNFVGVSVFSKPSLPVIIHDEESSGSESPYTTAVMKKSDVNLEYNILSEIGRGTYSRVYECIEKSTDRIYVAKCISIEFRKQALTEYECLRKMNHPRIVKLEEAFDTPDHTILILEYITNGDLSSYIVSTNPLEESKAAKFIRHVTEGLLYLHDLGFVHANLSPNHLFLSSDSTELKIAGFSCVRFVEENNQFHKLPLTPEYHAPESVQLQPMTTSADMWSLGAIILFMLTGHKPFECKSTEQLITDICSISINSKCNENLSKMSSDCYDIVFNGLLLYEPKKRLTSHQCQRHRWLQNIGTGTQASDDTGTRPSLKHMNTQEQMEYFLAKYQNVLH